MRKIYCRLAALFAAAYCLLPDLAMAGGEKAEALIVVADTRRVTSPTTIFFLNLYNSDPFMFGIWCTIITLAMGVTLGFTTDFLMKRTGLDLTSRKLVEH